jgi:hypothetical protein
VAATSIRISASLRFAVCPFAVTRAGRLARDIRKGKRSFLRFYAFTFAVLPSGAHLATSFRATIERRKAQKAEPQKVETQKVFLRHLQSHPVPGRLQSRKYPKGRRK